MSFAPIIRCIFILALCSAEPVRRRRLSIDRENEKTMAGRSMKQIGHISLVNVNEISKADVGMSHNPTTHLETESIVIETNARENKNQEPTVSNLRMKVSSNLAESEATSKATPTRLGQVEHRGQFRNQNLRHRRTTQRCNGMKKIVQCKDDVAEETCKKALIDAGVELLSDMPNTPFFAICVGSEDEALLVAALTEMEGIEDDPPRTLSYIPGSQVVRKLQSTEQVIPYGIDLVKAPTFWSQYGKRGGGVKVCVIDTGIRSSHEDLRDANPTGSNDSFLVTPWNEDGNGHGTHVSGTIIASDNGIGVIGVSPEASLHFVRVFDANGEFTASNLVDAMNACASAGAKIISMSLGGPSESSAERAAVANLKASGILLVAAAGNDGDGVNFVEYPAGYEPVLSVAAIDANLDIASFSTYNTEVDIAAPGVDVLSTIADSDTSYAQLSGTSMATPHVSGVAALLWSQFPDRSVDDIENAIKLSALDSGACGQDPLFGHGIVDAMAAAVYLESGGEATDQSGCVGVSVSLTTDDYGSETYYFITPKDDNTRIIYRGGPYPNGQRSTYTDDIQLQAGCYDLIWLDTVGDGTNNPQYGIGAISLTYQGNNEVDFNDFGGSEGIFSFGSCDGRSTPTTPGPTNPPVQTPTNPPVQSPTSPPVTTPTDPVPTPTDSPVSPPGDYTCGTGESHIKMSLETDQWSASENQLLFWDVAAPDDEWVWLVNLFEFEANSEYEGNACLLLSRCYMFYFLDEFGDGLATGGLTLTLDGQVVFQIGPGEIGTVYEQGSSVTYWSTEFGACSSTSTSSINFSH